MTRKTKHMLEIEKREGKPIEVVLADLYREHQTQSAVAEALGINQSTLSLWLIRLNMVERRVLVHTSRDGMQCAS